MREPLGQVHAVGPDPGGERWVRPSEENESPTMGDARQPPARGLGAGVAERAVDHAGPARQARDGGGGVGRAGGIGEEEEPRKTLCRAPARP